LFGDRYREIQRRVGNGSRSVGCSSAARDQSHGDERKGPATEYRKNSADIGSLPGSLIDALKLNGGSLKQS
jgi:hypothetical protein